MKSTNFVYDLGKYLILKSFQIVIIGKKTEINF